MKSSLRKSSKLFMFWRPCHLSDAEIIRELKRTYGTELASVLCGVPRNVLDAWARGRREPTEAQAKVVASAKRISDTLLGALPLMQVKMWWVTYSHYLYGIPAGEM